MSPDPTPGAGNMPPSDPPPRKPEPSSWAALYAPKLAVLVVAGAAVAAAFMGTRPETPTAAGAASSVPPPRRAVVQAPPLVVTAPPLKGSEPGHPSPRQDTGARGPAKAMGAAAACRQCGVVESVQAAAPGQSFEMRIRMDDGSVRTLEQRGALAAGTRVMVDGGSLRLMPG